MTSRIWLTVDDSPSVHTDALCDFLNGRGIPAMLFCRGDLAEQNPAPLVRAVQKGMVLANHGWSHRRAGQLRLRDMIDEIARTERLLEEIYRCAGQDRPGKYFRFPHVDRGCGGHILDAEKYPAYAQDVRTAITGGLNADMSPPTAAQKDNKAGLQAYLKEEGYTQPWAESVKLPWFAETELAQAADCLFTFSSCDWMLTARHQGRWPCKTLDDLKARIDEDTFLRLPGDHVVLLHDQPELFPVFCALVEHFKAEAFSFVSLAGETQNRKPAEPEHSV